MKNKIHLVIIFMIVLSVICISGCSKKEDSTPNQFKGLAISSDFLISDECEQLSEDVKFYLIWVQNSYNCSDKKSFDTYDYDELEFATDQIENIESHKNDVFSITEESLVKTKLVGYYLKIQYILSEKELLEVAGNTKSEDWFNELGTELDSICQEMSDGYK